MALIMLRVEIIMILMKNKQIIIIINNNFNQQITMMI